MNKLISYIDEVKKNYRTKKHIRKNFPQEELYMRGTSISSDKNQSILYFTVHRCASRYVGNIIKKLMANSGMSYIDIVGYLWHGGKVHQKDMDVYKKCGYVYGPFYGLDKDELEIPIFNYDDYKIFLMLRDPRDVLTSYYFHHAFDPYCNPAQQEYINNRSKNALNMTVDEWILEKIPMFRERYKTYIETFYGKPNVLFMRYEDMISDFNKWLQQLMEFMNVHPAPEIAESIRRQADFTVKKEDVKSHKRQVTPGDHVRKLKTATVDIMNSEFGDVLSKLNYK